MPALRLSVSTFLRRRLHKDSKERVRDQRVRLSLEGSFETAAPHTAALSQWRRIVVIGAAALLTGALVATTAADTQRLSSIVNAVLAEGPNDFFNELAARADVYKGDFNIGSTLFTDIPMAFSMRPDPSQLTLPRNNGVAASRWYRQLNRKVPARTGGFLDTRFWPLRDDAVGRQVDFAKYHYVCWDNNPATACTDSDPNAQDAVKVIIPAFDPLPATTLSANINASQLTLPVVENVRGAGALRRSLKVCNEIVTVTRGARVYETTYQIVRGQHGTTAASCPMGSPVYVGQTIGQSAINLPIQTRWGANSQHTYLYVYDLMFTESFLGLFPYGAASGLGTHKLLYLHSFGAGNGFIIAESTYRIRSGPYHTLANYDDATDQRTKVGLLAFRIDAKLCNVDPCTYTNLPKSTKSGWAGNDNPDQAGTGVTVKGSFPQPVVNNIAIRPNVWMRIFIKVEQRIGDFDLVSIWLNDETTDTVQVLNRLQFCLADGVKCASGHRAALATPNNLDDAQWGFNSSDADLVRNPHCVLATYAIGDLDDQYCNLTWYLRNFVVLEDPPDGDTATIIRRKPVPSGAPN